MPLSPRRVGDARADDTTRHPPPFLFRALKTGEVCVALLVLRYGAFKIPQLEAGSPGAVIS